MSCSCHLVNDIQLCLMLWVQKRRFEECHTLQGLCNLARSSIRCSLRRVALKHRSPAMVFALWPLPPVHQKQTGLKATFHLLLVPSRYISNEVPKRKHVHHLGHTLPLSCLVRLWQPGINWGRGISLLVRSWEAAERAKHDLGYLEVAGDGGRGRDR